MNDFEVLSRDAAESGEPVEPKRDVETPVEPETVRRVRVGLDALTAELAEAKETVAYLEARENELLAENAELSRSLDLSRRKRDAEAEVFETIKRDLRDRIDFLAKERDAARLDYKRLEPALDAALNDVEIFHCAAVWLGFVAGVASLVAFVAICRAIW
ncbi:MAG: hypothetical protein IJY15_10425 [Thermoguttaceae bacterium]|nr:hypothetical protein [Thermoguttaceae bacterium]